MLITFDVDRCVDSYDAKAMSWVNDGLTTDLNRFLSLYLPLNLPIHEKRVVSLCDDCCIYTHTHTHTHTICSRLVLQAAVIDELSRTA